MVSQIFISKDPDYLIPNKISDDILFQYKANGTYSKIEKMKKLFNKSPGSSNR